MVLSNQNGPWASAFGFRGDPQDGLNNAYEYPSLLAADQDGSLALDKAAGLSVAAADDPRWFGFNFPSWWDGVYGSSAANSSLAELGALGANSVAFTPTQYVASRHGSDIFTTQQSESDAHLIAAMDEARALGLDVMLKPHIDIADWSASRLDLVPDDTAAFFAEYSQLMVHYASMAQQAGVGLFSIGTELSSITGAAYTNYWTDLIADVREVYTGKLTYAANWGEEDDVGFWQQLDYVGVDFYAPLTQLSNPTHQQLVDALTTAPANPFTSDLYGGKAPLDYYADLSAALGRPLIFTEVGWNAVDGGNMQWSNTVQNPAVDTQEQADIYAAFIEAVSRPENDYVDGVFFWGWGPQVDPNNPYSMSVEDHPARAVVQDGFEQWSSVPPPVPATFAEFGTTAGVKTTGTTIQLTHDFIDPIVIVSTVGYSGTDPVNARVVSVQDHSFRIRIQEPEYLDNSHATEKVSWMVVERGTWQLENGTHVQAGTHSASGTVPGAWQWVDLAPGFRGTPIVLSQVQSSHDATWVTTRERNVNSTHFEFGMQREEALSGRARGAETLGYLAMEPSDGTSEGHRYWAGSAYDQTQAWSHVDFSGQFGSTPTVLASLSTTNDLDTGVVRFNRLSGTGMDLMVQEESSRDAERVHARESVDFLALQGHGVLTGFEWEPLG